jgi:hypothetical protein
MVRLLKRESKGDVLDLILIDIRNANSEAELDRIKQGLIQIIHGHKRILSAIRKQRIKIHENKK